jgi:hypothetical protein
MVLYHEALPYSYLLVLAPDHANAPSADLAQHLDRACGSGKPAVWVDCRLLDTLSAKAARLLLACHQRLRRRRVRLVLCRVSERLEQTLRQAFTGPDCELCLVPSLDDAADQPSY